MTYNGTENRARMYWEYSQKAINQALTGKWRDAIETNEYLLTHFPDDVDSHNRLGKAHLELGDHEAATASFEKTQELVPTNPIARRNLEHLKVLMAMPKRKRTKPKRNPLTAPIPSLFLEETGKAIVTTLAEIGEENVLQRLAGGENVSIIMEENKLKLQNHSGEYIGSIDTKLAMRVIRLMLGGNQYSAGIVTVTTDEVRVILKETYQDPNQIGQISFPSYRTEGFRAYTKNSLIHEYGASELRAAMEDESAELDGGENDEDNEDSDSDEEEPLSLESLEDDDDNDDDEQ
ncbi:MAG: tetratricopeptide repeat protein [SAR202 cluster bacterium]|nr:tetratricopeptide repeat protein [SAR202 cluster bacterium]|tara:strand:+ start:5173 stop:6045 length:873 start_codon:yes stop_codon:yes gene_type:complete